LYALLADIDIPRVASNDVMLLIGTDAPERHIPIEVRAGDGHQPFAVRTRLGSAVRGPLPAADNTNDVTIGSMQKFNRVTSGKKAMKIDVITSKTRHATRGGLRRCYGACTAKSTIQRSGHARTKKMSPMQEPVIQEPKIQRKQRAKRKRKSSSYDPHPQTNVVKKYCYTGT